MLVNLSFGGNHCCKKLSVAITNLSKPSFKACCSIVSFLLQLQAPKLYKSPSNVVTLLCYIGIMNVDSIQKLRLLNNLVTPNWAKFAILKSILHYLRMHGGTIHCTKQNYQGQRRLHASWISLLCKLTSKVHKKWWFAYQLRWCNYQIHGLVQCFLQTLIVVHQHDGNASFSSPCWQEPSLRKWTFCDLEWFWAVICKCWICSTWRQLKLEWIFIRKEREREKKKNDVEVQRQFTFIP